MTVESSQTITALLIIKIFKKKNELEQSVLNKM